MHKLSDRRPHTFAAFKISYANYSAWIFSARTILCLAFVMALTYMEVSATQNMLTQMQWKMGALESIFYHLDYGCNIIMSTAMFMIMICKLPMDPDFHIYLAIRSNRRKWLAGQLLCCIEMALFVMALLITLICAFSIGSITFDGKWSDTTRVLDGMPENFALISKEVREAYSPLQAILIAAAPIVLFWLVITFTILACNLSGLPTVGVLLCALTLLSSIVVNTMAFSSDPRWLPLQYATFKSITSSNVPYASVIAGYIVLLAVLVIYMEIVVKKYEFTKQ